MGMGELSVVPLDAAYPSAVSLALAWRPLAVKRMPPTFERG